MSILPFLPIAVGLALVCTPFSTPPATTVPPAAQPDAHPHHPMGTKVGCVNGSFVFDWFTLPYNPEQMKKATPNYTWTRGFTFKTTVPLKSGDVTVKPGNYQLDFQLDGEGKNWSVVLGPPRARRRGFGGNQGTASKVERFEIPTKSFKGEHAEHLDIVAINRGYKRKSLFDATPIEGTTVEFRVSFGDTHKTWTLQEVLADKKGEKK